MTAPLISIVVPIYNVEKYIAACARSLFEQDYPNIEFIFWNDCSTDRSIDILTSVLEEYPERKKQVFIGHNEKNLGLAKTRHKAFEYMKGEYLWCIDSDDWIDTNACSLLIDFVSKKNADIIFFDFMMEFSDHNLVEKMNNPENSEAFLLQILRTTKNGNLANKFIHRTFFTQYYQPIPGNIKIGEDFSVMIHILRGNPEMFYLPKALYHYRMQSDSMTHQITKQFFESQICFQNYIEKVLKTDEEKIAFAEFQARSKLRILMSKIYPVKEAYKLFPAVNTYLPVLQLPYCYKIALKSFSGGLPFIGFGFVYLYLILQKMNKLVHS